MSELLLTIRETARRLGVSISTAGRMLEDEELQCVRQRSRRKANADQVNYVIAAIRAGRSGSVREFAAEWAANQDGAAA